MANDVASDVANDMSTPSSSPDADTGAPEGPPELEQRLAQCMTGLEAARREIDSFVYAVAHDLRAPLRLISAHVGMLREHCGSREARIHLDQIERGAQYLTSMINGLLEISRLAQAELHRAPTPLDDLVNQAREQLEPLTRDRAIEWSVGRLPTADCDPQLMLQVFVNLIGNALKYSRPRPRARIEIGAERAQDGQAQIFVRDNGVGFDMRYAGKLFGVFERLHRQDEFEGAGVGLAIASRIIRRHGGRIWAEGRVGEGAVVKFTLGDNDAAGG